MLGHQRFERECAVEVVATLQHFAYAVEGFYIPVYDPLERTAGRCHGFPRRVPGKRHGRVAGCARKSGEQVSVLRKPNDPGPLLSCKRPGAVLRLRIAHSTAIHLRLEFPFRRIQGDSPLANPCRLPLPSAASGAKSPVMIAVDLASFAVCEICGMSLDVPTVELHIIPGVGRYRTLRLDFVNCSWFRPDYRLDAVATFARSRRRRCCSRFRQAAEWYC
jgi:hypothetical protein